MDDIGDDNGVDDDATGDGHASDAVADDDVVMMTMLVIMLMMVRIVCEVGRIQLDSMFNCVYNWLK